MVAKPLFRKNYFLFTGIILLCFSLYTVFSFLIHSISRDMDRQEKMTPPPQVMLAKLLQASGDPVRTLQKLKKDEGDHLVMKIDLVDASGKSLVDGNQALPVPLTEVQLAELEKGQAVAEPPPGQGPPETVISRLDQDGQFLVVHPHFGDHFPGGFPPPGMGGHGPPRGLPPFFFTSLISFLVCIFISVGIALLIFFSNYRKRAQEALSVLDSMKSGDLGVRMPTGKLDELAPLTQAFNQMADEVQRLVVSVRKSDQSRRQLLQDLAHDLRTPLASLRTFMELLSESEAEISEKKRKEIYQLCLSEVVYYSSLVEDLLFLAQISEPQYVLGSEHIDLVNEMQNQVAVFKARFPGLHFKLDFNATENFQIEGSLKLISRLFRNAFENSAGFAAKQLEIKIEHNGDFIQIALRDDGPGFSEKALKEFGFKKASREITGPHNQKRISVGIGSVIMREISQLHLGSMQAENIIGNGQIKGAQVLIMLTSSIVS